MTAMRGRVRTSAVAETAMSTARFAARPIRLPTSSASAARRRVLAALTSPPVRIREDPPNKGRRTDPEKVTGEQQKLPSLQPEPLGLALDREGRALVLLERPDVVPVRVAAERGDALPGRQEAKHELRELAGPVGQVAERALVVDVDAHAHVEPEARLLAVVADLAVLGLDDPEVDVDTLGMHRDRQRGVTLSVERHQLAVVERREDVPVHDEEGPAEVGDVAQGAGRPERLALPVVADPSLGRQVRLAQVELDELPQVADAEVDPLAPQRGQVANDVLEHGPVRDRHERLGDDRRVRPQPRAETSGQDDGGDTLERSG